MREQADEKLARSYHTYSSPSEDDFEAQLQMGMQNT